VNQFRRMLSKSINNHSRLYFILVMKKQYKLRLSGYEGITTAFDMQHALVAPQLENIPWWGKNILRGANERLRGRNILNIIK